ncbi:TRIC cation channel family protein [Thioalkalivibrio thiocyanodenitrificans]|uniref:TRIC cation channel family protein n=1 Tax=Thioalkalivibrio thiocyanodenitrificans TaxID=243063 RepID=UPI0009FD0FD3|nr:TRIC cation channel family protein [Thioalkalivibrio thiocyanodenitrificans]
MIDGHTRAAHRTQGPSVHRGSAGRAAPAAGMTTAICRFLVLSVIGLCIAMYAQHARADTSDTLRVQLLWEHQSQFAGFYVAQVRRHFEAEGLRVELIPGGPGINPITELQEGRADVAMSWLGNAWVRSTPDSPVVNIAQILSGSSLAVLCRISMGVLTPADIQGKRVGHWGLGDEEIIRQMLRRLDAPRDSVVLAPQAPGGVDLIVGNVDCASAMAYNEYWQVMQGGVPPSDIIMVSPEVFGIPHIEDGLYVMADRLESPEFRAQMVGLVRALRQGWREAAIAPTLAVESVLRFSEDLDRDHQRHMLETMLSTIPDGDDFGHFDLARYDAAVESWLSNIDGAETPPRIWTHMIWNQLRAEDGEYTPLSAATQHYSARVMAHPAFEAFVLFGVLVFALSGVLEAINRGYDMWGRLILAFLSGIGGGTLRDLLIGGDRIPFYYVKDLSYPLGILLVVVGASVVTSIFQGSHKSRAFKQTKNYADIVGFSVLATAGAQIAVASNMPWYWAPICAALTCAGGGMLRDIVINQEPKTFKGVIYEEAAVVGALVFLAGMFVADRFEGSAIPVYLSVAVCVLVIIAIRVAVHKFDIKYPRLQIFHKARAG